MSTSSHSSSFSQIGFPEQKSINKRRSRGKKRTMLKPTPEAAKQFLINSKHEDICPICLEAMNESDSAPFPECKNHLFHCKCLKEMQLYSARCAVSALLNNETTSEYLNVCPICRRKASNLE